MISRASSLRATLLVFTAVILLPVVCGAAESAKPADDVTRLPAFHVKGDQVEEFGFRVSPARDLWGGQPKVYHPVVDLVLPNTAASKAGLHPGDRILEAEGRSTDGGTSLRDWHRLQDAKWREISSGAEGITWRLLVRDDATGAQRSVILRLPTPAPRWGATEWRVPQDRVPVELTEPGPLSERAEEILNNGMAMILRGIYVKAFQLPTDPSHPNVLTYQWTLWDESGTGHRMYVSRQRGRTDIVLEVIHHSNAPRFSSSLPTSTADPSLAPATTVLATDSSTYLTSPSGQLEATWRLHWYGTQGPIPPEEAWRGFQAELAFWQTRVAKTSPLWPLGLKPKPAAK